MFVTLTVLTALISIMFVASVASSVSELRRESDDFKDYAKRNSAF